MTERGVCCKTVYYLLDFVGYLVAAAMSICLTTGRRSLSDGGSLRRCFSPHWPSEKRSHTENTVNPIAGPGGSDWQRLCCWCWDLSWFCWSADDEKISGRKAGFFPSSGRFCRLFQLFSGCVFFTAFHFTEVVTENRQRVPEVDIFDDNPFIVQREVIMREVPEPLDSQSDQFP